MTTQMFMCDLHIWMVSLCPCISNGGILTQTKRDSLSLSLYLSFRLFWHLSRDQTAVAVSENVSLGSKGERREKKIRHVQPLFFSIDGHDRRRNIQGIHSFERAHLFNCLLSPGLLQLKLHKGSEISQISETTVPLNLPCMTSRMVRCHITRSS